MKSNKNVLFSVIVPIYNVENYLRYCLESVMNQTYTNWELVCVNDGSTDNSSIIISFFKEMCNRVKVINQKNAGPAHARNAGIDAAQGDYIIFLDSDDTLEENALETLYNKINNLDFAPDVIVYGGNYFPRSSRNDWLDKALSTRDKVYKEFSPNILFKESGSHPFIWLNCVRRDFLNENKLRIDENLDLGEDQLFQFEYFPKAKGVVFISDKLYWYNATRDDSLMSKYYSIKEYKLTKHLEQINSILKYSFNNFPDRKNYLLDLIDWLIQFVSSDILLLNNLYLKYKFCVKLINIIETYHKLTDSEIIFLKSRADYEKISDIASKNLKKEVNKKISDINAELVYIDEIEKNIKNGKKYKVGKFVCKVLRKKEY